MHIVRLHLVPRTRLSVKLDLATASPKGACASNTQSSPSGVPLVHNKHAHRSSHRTPQQRRMRGVQPSVARRSQRSRNVDGLRRDAICRTICHHMRRGDVMVPTLGSENVTFWYPFFPFFFLFFCYTFRQTHIFQTNQLISNFYLPSFLNLLFLLVRPPRIPCRKRLIVNAVEPLAHLR